jgi:hypothetical protein
MKEGENELEARLRAYRDATENVAPRESLATFIVATTAQRAKWRRFARDARAGLAIAAAVCIAATSWASLATRQLEAELSVQLGAWAEEP